MVKTNENNRKTLEPSETTAKKVIELAGKVGARISD